MAKGKKHKSQHYVPRSYTAAWADPRKPERHDPYVWVFERQSRSGGKKAPKNIFEETDFYTIHSADGTRDLILETGLSGLEAAFVAIRSKLATHASLTSHEFVRLLVFVAAMNARTRAQRDHQREQWGRAKNLMESMIEHLEKSTPAQRDALARASSRTRRPDQPTASYDDVKAMVDNPMQHALGAMIEAMSPILARMNLAVLETADDLGFITSDNPCVIYDPEAYKRPPMYRSAGLGYRSVEVTLPISPSQLLLFSWSDLKGFVPIQTRHADEINRRTRYYAYEHFVVRRDDTKDIWFEAGQEPADSWEKTHPSEPTEQDKPE